MSRARLRRTALGLMTLMGLPRGYFIPYRYAGGIAPPATPYPAVEARFAAADFRARLAGLDEYADPLLAIGAAPPPAPRWRQDWFPRLDAAMLYAMVRRQAPARIVEVGGGHSTRFVARAIADGGLAARVTVIDPAPRADLAGLPLTLVRSTVQSADPAPFAALAPGDMLLIDSSHVLMPGSDVDLLLNRLLPGLPAGVLVHIHDVFLPDDYPAAWRWRGYGEQLAVAPLLAGGRAAPLFASHYAATRLADAVRASVAGRLPLLPGAVESGLWLELRQAGQPP